MEEIMFEAIVITISVIAVIGGGALAWWLENGPDKENSSDAETADKKTN